MTRLGARAFAATPLRAQLWNPTCPEKLRARPTIPPYQGAISGSKAQSKSRSNRPGKCPVYCDFTYFRFRVLYP